MNFNDIRRAALLLTAGVSIACSESPAETDGSIPQSQAPVFSAEIANQTDDSRAYVDDQQDYYVLWEDDDRISVFYKGCKTPSTYVLETGAGEQLATFKADGSVTEGTKTNNCAAYPMNASATYVNGMINYPMPAVQTYKPGRYAGLEPHMVAHCIPDEQFVFRTFAGYLALKLYTAETAPVKIKSVKLETPSGEPISGTMIINANEMFTALDEGGVIYAGESAVTLDCGEGVELSTDRNNPTLFAFTLPVNVRENETTGGYQGLKFTVTDTDGGTMEIATQRNIGVSRGRITTMAPKAFEPAVVEEAIDLSIAPDGSQQPSNCYVVTKAGRYKFPTLHVDGSTIERYSTSQTNFTSLAYTATASYDEWGWMWKTEGVEISDLTYDPATRYFSFTVENFVPGSISIVARDKAGRYNGFIHNWHIWFVDDLKEIEVQGKGSKNYTLLDRNIGATTNDAASLDSYGFLYQWGNKDPKYNNTAGSVNCAPTINTNWAQYAKYPELLSAWQFDGLWSGWEDRNNYPLTISCGVTRTGNYLVRYDYNWLQYYPDTRNIYYIQDYSWANTLWSSSKTNYDPCPVGYRVPTQAEINDLTTNSTAEGWTLTDGTEVMLPFQNGVNHKGNTEVFGNAVLWTSTYFYYAGDHWNDPSYGAYIYCPSNNDPNGQFYRAYALPVRCIKQ